MAARRQLQNVSDAAALAASDALYRGDTEAQATAAAQAIVTANGFPVAALSMTYTDNADGTVTAGAALASSNGNLMMKVAGDASTALGVTASARSHPAVVQGGQGPGQFAAAPAATTCAVCVTGPAQSPDMLVQGSAGVTVSGGNVAINSAAAGALSSGGTSQSSPPVLTVNQGAIDVVGGYTGGTYRPAPTTGAAPFNDPFGSIPEPTGADIPKNPGNNKGAISASYSKSATVSPGVYSTLDESGSNTILTLNPGIYVITGNFGSKASNSTQVCQLCGGGGSYTTADSGGFGLDTYTYNPDSIVANGVMLYFACPSNTAPYFMACPTGATNMGSFVVASATSLYLSPPTSGPWAGMSIFMSRGGTMANRIEGTASDSIKGSIYALNSQLSLYGSSGSTVIDSALVVNLLALHGNSALTIAYNAADNAPMAWPTSNPSPSPTGSATTTGPPPILVG